MKIDKIAKLLAVVQKDHKYFEETTNQHLNKLEKVTETQGTMFTNHISQQKEVVKSLATKWDVQRVFDNFKSYPSHADLDKFREEIKPIAEEAVQLLNNNKSESQTFREIIRRFDEVLSDKASKHTIVELRKELESSYVKIARLQDLSETVTAMTVKNEKLLAKIHEKFD